MIGETISHYRIEAELGSGGMGVVYRAVDIRLQRPVALKFLPARLGQDAGALDRFQREARAASALNHPNICTIYDVGEGPDGKPFLVMELLEGETMQARLRRGPLASADILDMGAQVAGALEAAHARGIVHRDLKPANLFLTASGPVKVLDFGLAKILPTHAPAGQGDDAPTLFESPAASALTQAGSTMGTVAYMSPEQARGDAVDARSDLFSLAVVLYEAVTGRGAFPGATSAVVFDGILNRTPDLTLVRSPEVAAILQKALEKDPSLRYQTAADLRADLRRLARNSGSSPAVTPATAAHAPAARRGVPGWAWAAAAMAGLAALAGWYFFRPKPMLAATDTVVLADFNNSTGDAMFNGALRQGLSAQLEQTPFLHLVSDERMSAAEKLMTLAPNTPLVGDVARQLCQRTASAATIEGSIAQIGNEYNLILRAVNCVSGDSLATAEATATGKDQVLASLGAAAHALRAKLGESLSSMRQFGTPIEQATTPSLEALQDYTRARQALRDGDNSAAIALLQHTLTLDPNFAMAYATLATAQTNSEGEGNPPPEAVASITKAYSLRDRVSERERFYIVARYDDIALNDSLQTVREYRTWAQTYPNDSIPLGNASVSEDQIGFLAQSLADAQAASRLEPDNLLFAGNLADAYRILGRESDNQAALASALQRWPNSEYVHQIALFADRDFHLAASWAHDRAWLATRPDSATLLHIFACFDAYEAGQVGRLRQVGSQWIASERPDDAFGRAMDQISIANLEAFLGNRAAAESGVA
ncbi:MAG TPA: serine/threonine-protein kinase, partial [Terriglobales bacterium]|nr:serine/threonine-protein kinase [Terriglobales bacterium]